MTKGLLGFVLPLLVLGVYASWSDAERILPNVMRCYQEFRNELDLPLDLGRMLDGMERLRGRATDHTCL